MGGIAFVRQAFVDAQHYQRTAALAEATREPYDAALAAMGPALSGIAAGGVSRPPRRARFDARSPSPRSSPSCRLSSAGRAPKQVVQELKAADARVVVSVNYPTRPKDLAPDADESLEALQARADGAARRRRACGSRRALRIRIGGLEGRRRTSSPTSASPSERGLSREAAIRALTLDSGDAGRRRRPAWDRSSGASAPTCWSPRATCSTPSRRSSMSSSAGA